MDKADYVLRSLSKIAGKRWEHYAINRIFHRLNDPEVEFICQQCIRKDGKPYLVDLYLPQFSIYLEVNESHHESDKAIIADAVRRLDIADVSGLEEIIIPTSGNSIETVNKEIENFIELLRNRKRQTENFPAWRFEDRYKPEPHIERGEIAIGPHSAFRYQRDSLRCFGYTGGHFQRGVWRLSTETVSALELDGGHIVWFPRLYDQELWDNSLSEDGRTITEIYKGSDEPYTETGDRRIVMARSRNWLNQTLYRFVGVFEVIPEYSSGNERRFRRIAESVKTVAMAAQDKTGGA